MSSKHEASPFAIHIPDAQLDDLLARLKRTRFPDDFANDDWRYGYNTAYHRELVDYWINTYDWRDVERRMNQLPQFKIDLMGVPLHFIHVRGKDRNPMPLLLHHGWPWTFWDRQYRVHTDGGHFAPLEVPDIYVDDVRTFFRNLR